MTSSWILLDAQHGRLPCSLRYLIWHQIYLLADSKIRIWLIWEALTCNSVWYQKYLLCWRKACLQCFIPWLTREIPHLQMASFHWHWSTVTRPSTRRLWRGCSRPDHLKRQACNTFKQWMEVNNFVSYFLHFMKKLAIATIILLLVKSWHCYR